MFKMRGVWVLTAVTLCLLLTAQQAYGQRRGGRGGGGGGGGGGGAPPKPDPNLNPTVIADRAEITTIQSDMLKLSKHIEVATNTATAEFHKTDDYVAAKKAMDDANAELTAAKAAVVKKLAGTPEYKAAKDKEKAAQTKLDDMKAKNAARDLITVQSSEVLKVGGTANKLERDAIAADPACIAAQKKVADATAALKVVNDALAEQLKANAELTDLKAKQTEAKTKLVEANKKLTQDFASASQ